MLRSKQDFSTVKYLPCRNKLEVLMIIVFCFRFVLRGREIWLSLWMNSNKSPWSMRLYIWQVLYRTNNWQKLNYSITQRWRQTTSCRSRRSPLYSFEGETAYSRIRETANKGSEPYRSQNSLKSIKSAENSNRQQAIHCGGNKEHFYSELSRISIS